MLYNDKEVNLQVGQAVKNYKEMCKLLGEKETSGDGKVCQIANWQRFFDFQREGQKMIVTNVYDVPALLPERKRTRGGIYIDYIECLLMKILQEKHEIIISKIDLCLELGMVNENYTQYYNDINMRSKAIEELNRSIDIEKKVEPIDLIVFYRYTILGLSKILHSSLESMKNRRLLDYSQTYIAEMDDGSKRLITANEEKIIVNIEEKMLSKMGCDDKRDLVWDNKFPIYRRKVNEAVRDKFHNIKRISPVLHITYNENVDEHRPLSIDAIRALSTEQQKRELNNRVCKKFNDILDRL